MDHTGRELIFSMLRHAVSEQNSERDYFNDIEGGSIGFLLETLQKHGLAAYAYEIFESGLLSHRLPKDFVMQLISSKIAAEKSYARISGVTAKIADVFRENGIKCLMLKGMALAEYYPRPELRQFNDVDLYAPDRADEIDEAFWAMGVKVDSSFYRHSHMYVNGVLVENHHYLLDVRGRKMMESLEADLKDIASACLAEHDGPGLYYPDVRFSLIFNLHHALSHFIYEGISFRFLIDWILFLRRNRDRLNTEQTAEDLNRHMLMKFAAVMTAVCVRYLGLSSADVPDSIRTAMDASDPELVERFIDDLFRPYEQIHYKNIFMQRLHSVRRIVRASWKPEAFLDQSAFDFVFDKFLPVLLGRKYMAD